MRAEADVSRKKVDLLGQPSFRWEVGLVFPAALNHCIVGVGHLVCGFSLCFIGGAGYYINDFAFAVEGNNLNLIFFEAAVFVE